MTDRSVPLAPCIHLGLVAEPGFSPIVPQAVLTCAFGGPCRYQAARRLGATVYPACSGWTACVAPSDPTQIGIVPDPQWPDAPPTMPQHPLTADELQALVVAVYFADWQVERATALTHERGYATALRWLVGSARRLALCITDAQYQVVTDGDQVQVSAPGASEVRLTLQTLTRLAFSDPTLSPQRSCVAAPA